jgi:hypothetical protein
MRYWRPRRTEFRDDETGEHTERDGGVTAAARALGAEMAADASA